MPNTTASTASAPPATTTNGIQAIATAIEPMTTAAVAAPLFVERRAVVRGPFGCGAQRVDEALAPDC